jgi:hypothetical protein
MRLLILFMYCSFLSAATVTFNAGEFGPSTYTLPIGEKMEFTSNQVFLMDARTCTPELGCTNCNFCKTGGKCQVEICHECCQCKIPCTSTLIIDRGFREKVILSSGSWEVLDTKTKKWTPLNNMEFTGKKRHTLTLRCGDRCQGLVIEVEKQSWKSLFF